jgi:hypothetical protein
MAMRLTRPSANFWSCQLTYLTISRLSLNNLDPAHTALKLLLEVIFVLSRT